MALRDVHQVTHAGLRQAAGLPEGQDVFSFEELSRHKAFLKAAEAVHEKLREDREVQLDPIEREISTLYDMLTKVSSIFTGEALRIVPHPSDAAAAWFSLADLDKIDAPAIQRVKTLTAALVVAYKDGNKPVVEACRFGPGQAPGGAVSLRLPDGKRPAHRGALQPPEAVPAHLDLVPARLPHPHRELPAAPRAGWAAWAWPS